MNKVEEHLYAIAAQEVAAKKFIPALMAKAFSDADGDEKKSIARYIKLRVQQLTEEYLAAQAETEARQQREAWAREDRQKNEQEQTLRKTGDNEPPKQSLAAGGFQEVGPLARPPSLVSVAIALIPCVAMCFTVRLWDRIDPVVLGLPFNVFWVMLWILLTPPIMWQAYRIERRRQAPAEKPYE
jgi:hypothetical protein